MEGGGKSMLKKNAPHEITRIRKGTREFASGVRKKSGEIHVRDKFERPRHAGKPKEGGGSTRL